MSQTVIENPVINSAYLEPTRHFKFSDEGITDEIIKDRRPSSYFVPIARPKKKNLLQISFDMEWTKDRIEENKLVNQIRERIKPWRQGGYNGVTPTTARLLAYWNDPQREKKLFFCQIEALETAIYITEVGRKFGDSWIENAVRDANNSSNPGLPRMAFKMATGSGKTGKLGEHVKCVVSVSMLTEGWDANTVTHILGVRAFGTQLLCEQVVGRALRRMSYAADEKGFFSTEYAEVYGVPFSFIPCSGSTAEPQPGPLPTRVRALETRKAAEIRFPGQQNSPCRRPVYGRKPFSAPRSFHGGR
jgi:hypothetical protein